jgi:hypothetical protein
MNGTDGTMSAVAHPEDRRVFPGWRLAFGQRGSSDRATLERGGRRQDRVAQRPDIEAGTPGRKNASMMRLKMQPTYPMADYVDDL